MSSGQRFKFSGSTISVQTGFGGTSPTPAISAISKTNPIIVTSPNTYAEADVVKLTSILGMTELNGLLFVVDDTTANDFSLAGQDGTMNNTYVSGGKVDQVVFSQYCELTGMNQQDGAKTVIDVSTVCSTAKEFELGLADSGTLTLDYNAAPDASAVEIALRAAKISGATIAFKIAFPGAGGTVVMLGIVQQQTMTGAVDQVWKGTAAIKLTGPIFVS